jgi:hypothetical protein
LSDERITRIGTGFYVTEQGALLVNVREILAEFNLPDTPEIRQAIWDQIRRDFGIIPITEIGDGEKDRH